WPRNARDPQGYVVHGHGRSLSSQITNIGERRSQVSSEWIKDNEDQAHLAGQQAVEAIHESRWQILVVNILGVLLTGLFCFSKIEAGKLDEVIGSVTTLTAQKAHEKGLEFLAHVARGIPEYLWGDPLRLGQMLTNPVNNICGHTG